MALFSLNKKYIGTMIGRQETHKIKSNNIKKKKERKKKILKYFWRLFQLIRQSEVMKKKRKRKRKI